MNGLDALPCGNFRVAASLADIDRSTAGCSAATGSYARLDCGYQANTPDGTAFAAGIGKAGERLVGSIAEAVATVVE